MNERGAASLFVCGLAVLMVALGLALGRLGAGAVVAARADGAADAAALAAATELAEGRSEAEARRTASVVAQANGATLTSCDCRDGRATVTVSVPAGFLSSFSAGARATARAELRPDCPVDGLFPAGIGSARSE